MGDNITEVSSFFKTTGTNTDVSNAIYATAWIFKLTTAVVSVIGFGAMAMYVLRIAVDIILIVGRGFNFVEKLDKYGTGKSGSYDSAGAYLKNNVPQIVTTFVLIIFLITGWIFNLVAIVVNGIGALINKFAKVDVIATASSLMAESYVEQVPTRQTSSLKKDYDSEVSSAKDYYNRLVQVTAPTEDDPKYVQLKTLYTQSMAKAETVAEELRKRNAQADLKLGPGYFDKHLRQNDDGTSFCMTGFFVDDVMDKFGKRVQCK